MPITIYSTSPAKPTPTIAFYASDAADADRLIAKAKRDILNRNKTYTYTA